MCKFKGHPLLWRVCTRLCMSVANISGFKIKSMISYGDAGEHNGRAKQGIKRETEAIGFHFIRSRSLFIDLFIGNTV